MNEIDLLKRSVLKKEFELQELFKNIANTQQFLRSAKLILKIYEENYKLDSLVYFCINGKYPTK